jgi:hypothetical protein
MKPAFDQYISLMRFFGSRKQTYANRLVVDFYLGQPFTVLFSYAKKTASVFDFWPSDILRVFQIRNFTQIRQSVVGAVSINMVNLIYWPSIVRVKPYQSMSKIKHIIKSDTYVSMLHLAPDNATYAAPAPNFSPRKKASFSAIIQKFMQSFWGHKVNINSAVCGGQV